MTQHFNTTSRLILELNNNDMKFWVTFCCYHYFCLLHWFFFLFLSFFFCMCLYIHSVVICNMKSYIKFSYWCLVIYISNKLKIRVLKGMTSKVQWHNGVIKKLFFNSIVIISFFLYLLFIRRAWHWIKSWLVYLQKLFLLRQDTSSVAQLVTPWFLRSKIYLDVARK